MLKKIIGQWMVNCFLHSYAPENLQIEGIILILSKGGEVRWNIPEGATRIPLFTCDIYVIIDREDKFYITFGNKRGHVLDLDLDTKNLDAGEIHMTRLSLLFRCLKIANIDSEESTSPPFSFLPALENGYFSDLEIKAGNGKSFHVHNCILKMSAPQLDWTTKPPPLTGLPEEVLGTALHYLYAQCLPPGLSEKTAEDIAFLLADVPGLQNVRSLCMSYVSHLSLKTRILDLLSVVHGCATHMTESFRQRNVIYTAPQVCDILKNSVRDAFVAYSKLFLIMHLYNERKGELTAAAGREVIRCMQSRGPPILLQWKKFLSGLTAALNGLDHNQRLNLARYLVPEVELLWDVIIAMVGILLKALETMMQHSQLEKENQVELPAIEEDLRELMNKEAVRLNGLMRDVKTLQEQLQEKRDGFREFSSRHKVRSMAAVLDQMIGELPLFLLRLDIFASELDVKLECEYSQFCFKVFTAKMSEMLRRIGQEKSTFKHLIIELCRLVNKEEFSKSLIELGLLEPSKSLISDGPEDGEISPRSRCGSLLKLTESLCAAPEAVNNPLSLAAGALLDSKEGTDMVFEVVENGIVTKVPAHRVILAARCDWFRRALLSGMQEAIQRRIEVHNCSKALFEMFLRYIYTGRIPVDTLTGPQLFELLELSDCYEVDYLKSLCEEAIVPYLLEDSVLEVIDFADQINACNLKSECIKFISYHPEVTKQDAFTDLSTDLKAEICRNIRLRCDCLADPYCGICHIPPTHRSTDDTTARLFEGLHLRADLKKSWTKRN